MYVNIQGILAPRDEQKIRTKRTAGNVVLKNSDFRRKVS